MDSYDVIIIGSGAGGGTLARHLAPSGKRILLLERGDWLPREPQNWLAQDVFVDNRYVSEDTWYDEKRQAVPAADPLLRGRGDEALRRRPLPAAPRGLRRAAAPRRRLARVADLVRRARAVLHEGRALLRGARQPRRGSNGRIRERAVSVPGRLARAADPAALGRPRGGRLAPVPRTVRDSPERVEHAVQRVRPLRELRRVRLRRAREVGCRGARRAAGARASERRARHERARRSSSRRTTTARRSPEWSWSGTARRRPTPPTSSFWPAAPRTPPSCCSSRRRTSIRTVSPTAPTRSGATTCSTTAWPCSRSHARRTRRSSRRRSGSTTSTSPATATTIRSATSRWSASRRRRCSAASGPARRSSRRSGRSRRSRSTRSTSGSRPRTYRCPRTASRSTRTAS